MGGGEGGAKCDGLPACGDGVVGAVHGLQLQGAVCVELGVGRFQPDGLVDGVQSVGGISLLGQGRGEIAPRFGMAGLERHRLPERLVAPLKSPDARRVFPRLL